jgi:ketosteroid isomerase-like protein
MKRSDTLHPWFVGAVLCAVVVAPNLAQAQEMCCLNNFRFMGGCMVVRSGSETCQSILAYLNNFNSVGKYYCDNTMIRGGWSLSECNGADNFRPETMQMSPVETAPARPAPTQRATPSDPPATMQVQDANLLQVSAPLSVRFDGAIDSSSQVPGEMVTGRLEQDLMDGDRVVAPAGSVVQAQLVPTSYWSNGAGDAYRIVATGIQVGDTVMPVSATAVSGTGETDTDGSEVSVPEGSLVSFEAEMRDHQAADKAILASATAAWLEAWKAKDADALTALYAQDAALLPPNAPAVFGRDAIRAAHKDGMAGSAGAELEDLEMWVAGDHGYKAGRYRMWNADGELVDRGKYIEIWTKIDGTWLIHRDIWNSSLPLPETHDHTE